MKQEKITVDTLTICCIATDYPQLGLLALDIASEILEANECIFFSTIGFVQTKSNNEIKHRIQVIKPFNSRLEYSEFIINELYKFVKTEFVLIVQFDGFPVNKQSWNIEYLNHDYIGAVWPLVYTNNVGNGGFSIRSKRLLTHAANVIKKVTAAEDVLICQSYKNLFTERYKIKFAPTFLANNFSSERLINTNSFGFHGLFNFPFFANFNHLQLVVTTLGWNELQHHDLSQLIKNTYKTKKYTQKQKIVFFLTVFRLYTKALFNKPWKI